MTRQALLAAAAAFTMIATPALAERGHSSEAATTEAATAPTEAAPAADAKAEKKTCRTYQNTVSRMKSERLCLTREQWRKFEEQQ
jgi:hypothetical protein